MTTKKRNQWKICISYLININILRCFYGTWTFLFGISIFWCFTRRNRRTFGRCHLEESWCNWVDSYKITKVFAGFIDLILLQNNPWKWDSTSVLKVPLESLTKYLTKNITFQERIQNPVKNLRWSMLMFSGV